MVEKCYNFLSACSDNLSWLQCCDSWSMNFELSLATLPLAYRPFSSLTPGRWPPMLSPSSPPALLPGGRLGAGNPPGCGGIGMGGACACGKCWACICCCNIESIENSWHFHSSHVEEIWPSTQLHLIKCNSTLNTEERKLVVALFSKFSFK